MTDPVCFPGNSANPFPLPGEITQEQLEADHAEMIATTREALRICESFLVKSAELADRRFYRGALFGAGLATFAFVVAWLLLR
ncbi:MAG: hypothetical protein ABI609_01055 [Acidobacteriota bacterium]